MGEQPNRLPISLHVPVAARIFLTTLSDSLLFGFRCPTGLGGCHCGQCRPDSASVPRKGFQSVIEAVIVTVQTKHPVRTWTDESLSD